MHACLLGYAHTSCSHEHAANSSLIRRSTQIELLEGHTHTTQFAFRISAQLWIDGWAEGSDSNLAAW